MLPLSTHTCVHYTRSTDKRIRIIVHKFVYLRITCFLCIYVLIGKVPTGGIPGELHVDYYVVFEYLQE